MYLQFSWRASVENTQSRYSLSNSGSLLNQSAGLKLTTPMVPHDDIATKIKHKAKFFIWTSHRHLWQYGVRCTNPQRL